LAKASDVKWGLGEIGVGGDAELLREEKKKIGQLKGRGCGPAKRMQGSSQ